MKFAVSVVALLILTVPAQARMRHDRICDFAQDRADLLNRSYYNPEGGNAVMFGTCRSIEDLPNGKMNMTRHHWWLAMGCGYQAYREGKQLDDNPYKNDELKDTWQKGWKIARKSCATDKLPTFNRDDTE